jgi:hypothetical protein
MHAAGDITYDTCTSYDMALYPADGQPRHGLLGYDNCAESMAAVVLPLHHVVYF